MIKSAAFGGNTACPSKKTKYSIVMHYIFLKKKSFKNPIRLLQYLLTRSSLIVTILKQIECVRLGNALSITFSSSLNSLERKK